MQIITCAGYHGTGSSAITNLVSEFSNVKSLGAYEFRFLHDPYGISDLEYNLVENHNRLNSGRAMKKYLKYVDFLSANLIKKKYEKFFDDQFRSLSYKYIDDLTECRYNGYWHYDLIDKGRLYYYSYRLLTKLVKIPRKFFRQNVEKPYKLIRHEISYCAYPSEEEFLSKTKYYTTELFKCANRENFDYLMIDQLFPPSNIDRYLRYIEDDIKIIVVDRDPRDLYLWETLYWKGTIIPRNVEDFCTWYEVTRRHRDIENYNSQNVLFIQFEDLIFNYESSVKKICAFIGFSPEDHIHKKELFDPEVVMKKTQLYKEHQDEKIAYIQKRLKKYCYNLP